MLKTAKILVRNTVKVNGLYTYIIVYLLYEVSAVRSSSARRPITVTFDGDVVTNESWCKGGTSGGPGSLAAFV